mmetsp:Transcript_4779/g.3973  ORF Transcript_4779/g.3973 Transcript_4779/m.3973 type:complete len:188 (+) Transcript_4779:1021-1584(+)
MIDKFISVFNQMRCSIVENIFEVFVRSANHAFQRKVNSLILFTININELKENQKDVWLSYLGSYQKVKAIVEENSPHYDKILMSEIDGRAMKKIKKTKTVDVEFRDNTNQWIEDTLVEVRERRAYDRKDPKNMENLYLFRLLTIKYRILYPLKGHTPVDVDPDLNVTLENRICQTLHRLVQVPETDN